MSVDIYGENLKLLQVRYPNLADKLASSPLPPDFQMVTAKNGLPTISLEDRQGRNVFLHSSYDPIQEAKNVVMNSFSDTTRINMIYGTGMGYHILEVLNKQSKNQMHIILEPQIELLHLFLRTNVATHVLSSPNIVIAAGDIDTICTSVVNTVAIYNSTFQLGLIGYLVLPGFERVYGEQYRRIQAETTKVWTLRYMTFGNSAHDTLIGVKNAFDNFKRMGQIYGINALKDKYKDRPAVIIAAGPSLDKNIHLLNDIKGKGLLLCCDASLKKVLKAGIQPDMVISVERDAEVYDYFFEDTEVPEDLWFAGLSVVDPRVFNKFGDQSIVCFRGTEPLSQWINELIGDKGEIAAGLSVANMAFSIARLMGANPIVFVGQDLAYAEGGKSHAEGTLNDYELQTIAKEPLVYVEDYNGNPIPSRDIWQKFLTWFQEQIAATPSTVFIDATEGGAKIKGTEIMPLQDVISKYVRDKIEPISKMLYDSGPPSKGFDANRAMRGMDGMLDLIENSMMASTADLYKYVRAVDNRMSKVNSVDEITDDIDKLEKDLNDYLAKFYNYPYSVVGFVTQSIFVMTAIRLNGLGKITTLDKLSQLTETLGAYYKYQFEVMEITKMMLEDIKADMLKTYKCSEEGNNELS
ncbi:MAG: motility associated factor glycosyltransferase family protein [Candidatus Saccharibacteria bacterium]